MIRWNGKLKLGLGGFVVALLGGAAPQIVPRILQMTPTVAKIMLVTSFLLIGGSQFVSVTHELSYGNCDDLDEEEEASDCMNPSHRFRDC